MSSFYGNSGVTEEEVEQMISEAEELMLNHIAFSVTQPEDQNIGDIWVILKEIS